MDNGGPGSNRSLPWRSSTSKNERSPYRRTSERENDRREKLRRRRHEQNARDRAHEPSQPASSSRVYVGNLLYIAQKQDVEKLFKDAGFEIVNIDISIDRFTNRNPSYCFVDLASTEEADRALNTLSGTELLGRPVRVKPSVQKHNSSHHSSRLQNTRWGTASTGPSFATSLNEEQLLLPVQERRRLIVSGLPKPIDQHTSDTELRELFEGFEVEAVSKVNWPRDGDVISGSMKNVRYAFVDLKSADDVERAVQQLDGVQRWGNKLRVGLSEGYSGKVFERAAWEYEKE